MIRNERLRVPEEGYKKGGRVKGKKSKKSKKSKGIRQSVRQSVLVNVQTGPPPKKRRATGKRKATGKGAPGPPPQKGAPSTTGMGSLVFGPPQAPSYFRAVAPDQQTFATLPGSLKSLQEGQTKTLKMLEYFDERGKKQEEINREYLEEFEMRPRAKTSARISPISSQGSIGQSPIQTLNTLQERVPSIPSAPVTSSVPSRFIASPSYDSPYESDSEPYRGADESIPRQAPASGDDMKAEAVVFGGSHSAFIPIRASPPESVSDAVDRASQPSSSIAPMAPRRERPRPAQPVPPVAPPKKQRPQYGGQVKPNPYEITSIDALKKLATSLGIKAGQDQFKGSGSTNRLRDAILEAQGN